MASTALNPASPVRLVVGGDEYLGDMTMRRLRQMAREARPDAELMELDASQSDRFAFEEAVGPSLMSNSAIVVITALESADTSLIDAMKRYCVEAQHDPESSIVIARHRGGNKGRAMIEQLITAGAVQEKVPDLSRDEAKLNFVMQCFERHRRRVEPLAAQQLVSVLGSSTGELAAMCEQLCFDFDADPITSQIVDQYLTALPQVTSFAVADRAMEGNLPAAIVAMRAAVEQGVDPIALIGALAMKLRTIAKASAVQTGAITASEAKVHPWALKQATRQVSHWTSQGLAACIETLAWADECSKKTGSDPFYALECAITMIARRGRVEANERAA